MDIRLRKDEVISLPAAAGFHVQVECGCVWLTRSRDRQDYILRKTETVDLDRGESAVLEALKDSCVLVESFGKVLIHL